jgi:aminoglycoside phosphotransferase (APT) family kinase protein
MTDQKYSVIDDRWSALSQWGKDVSRIHSLKGGVVSEGKINDVWSVRIDGKLAVARLGNRSDADLDWETKLLHYLDQQGLVVPTPIPTTDGRLFVDGLVVMKYLEGETPKTKSDFQLVAKTLKLLHQLTKDWPQRPGWRSLLDLLHNNTGTKINLNAMPPEGVARCRAAWAKLVGHQTCVIHGDTNPRNILIKNNKVALIDWDESHVDVPELDLGKLPHNAANLEEGAYYIAQQASAAWDAAVCWDDEYAVKRLSEVQ